MKFGNSPGSCELKANGGNIEHNCPLVDRSGSSEIQELRERILALERYVGFLPPPASPPPAPPMSPMVVNGLELWLDASQGSYTDNQAPSSWLDLSGNDYHFDNNMGNVKFNSETVNGQTVGYMDINTGSCFRRKTWDAYEDAESVTVEVWARLKGYRSTNTGIVTHFVGGGGKHNWMWNSGGGYHMNGMKGATNTNAGNQNTKTYKNDGSQWNRLVLVGRANHGYTFWVDDQKHHYMPFGGTLAYGGGEQWLGIGCREDVVEPANADISVVRIYNRALSDEELAMNCANATPCLSPALLSRLLTPHDPPPRSPPGYR